MRKTLYPKFIIAYLIFGFFGFFIVATFSSSLTKEHEIRRTAEQFYEEATYISKTYANDLYDTTVTIESAYSQLKAVSTYLSASIMIINPSGTVLLSSDSMPDISNPIVVKGFNPAATSNSYYMISDFFGTYDEDMLCVFTPITTGYKTRGYVVINQSISDLNKRSDSYLSITYITLAILYLLSLIILFFFTEFFYRPLRTITHAAKQFAAGNMHYESTVESNDELGYLSATLNYMASEIANTEDVQKKFVANVSHDFRSPLTSIKGYLEAMLDGTIPPEMHEKYLNIVLNETERLTKLTNSLLTLNNLNTKGMVLEYSDFDINTVIRNTCASFEGTCRNKGISINLILTGEEIFVHADMSKIQQVLYNLLDNAIKFSEKDSEITIETTEKNGKLFVSVKDKGIGIPKDSLNQIFDRFYKSDLSRGKDKKGTGLGLSITKEIIHSHGEKIDVISTEGVGSEFIFSLAESESEDEDD